MSYSRIPCSGCHRIEGCRIPSPTVNESVYHHYEEIPEIECPNSEINENDANRSLNVEYEYISSRSSPPPNYYAVITETWRSDLPPTYDDYLRHAQGVSIRSRTPPPPWSSESPTESCCDFGGNGLHQSRRDQLPTSSSGGRAEVRGVPRDTVRNRDQTIRSQKRLKEILRRSQSESRAQQQRRRAMMHEYGAFCMETTALQSAVENGFLLCNLM